jgi:hypothetical protein
MGENAARNALEHLEAFDRLEPILANVNEPGMLASERVHLGEIVVIYRIGPAGRSRGISPDRLPLPGVVDISAATPINAFQGRNHGD